MTTSPPPPLYWVELADGDLWLAESHADLVAGLVAGYLALTMAAREAARRDYATAAMAAAQEELFGLAIDAGTADIETIPDAVLDRLLGEEEDPDDDAPWDYEPIPLVVLAEPSADWLPPAGNVIVFDARQDGVFLLSLAQLGEIRSLGLVSGPALLAHPLGL